MFENIIDSLHRAKIRYAGRVDLAQIPFISFFRKRIISMMRKTIVEDVNGYSMFVDDIDSLALSWHHVFEPATTEFFKRSIRKGQTVVDLGANIGYYSLLFSGLVGSEGHVFAFEPEPESAELLRKNLELNSVLNVTVIEMAIDCMVLSQRLFVNKVNRGNHQIFDAGEERDSIEIQTTSLDEFFKGKDIQIDWIKMDIEGAEFRALNGMKCSLKNNPGLVLVSEIYAKGLEAAGSSVKEYIHLLKDLNFRFEQIDERRNIISPISPEELIRLSEQPRRFHPNIICRK